jgi:hypothetical protein
MEWWEKASRALQSIHDISFISKRDQYRIIYKVEEQRVMVLGMDLTAHRSQEITMGNKNFRPAQNRVAVSVGESVQIIRELQRLT